MALNYRNLNKFKDEFVPQFLKNTTNDVPWINNKLKILIRKRNNLFKRYKKNCNSFSKIKYIIARNNVTKQLKLAKKNYESKIIKRSKITGKFSILTLLAKIAKPLGKKLDL